MITQERAPRGRESSPWKLCEGTPDFYVPFPFNSRTQLSRLCSDAELIRNIWDRYDAQHTGAKVFTSLISALKRLVTEKPALLGVCSQMSGVGVPGGDTAGGSSSGSSYALDVGGMAGMVATAASATVSGVVGMIGSGAGLSVQHSGMKLQW